MCPVPDSVFHQLCENSPNGIMFVDPGGIILYANSANLSMISLRPEDVVGKHMHTFVPDDVEQYGIEKFNEIKQAGGAEGEIILISGDGKRVPVWAKAKAIYDDKGEFIGAVISAGDIASREETEAELRSKISDLEASLNYSRELASMIAHELRGLLVPVAGYNDLLIDGSFGELPENAIKALKTIRNRIRDLTTLIDDLYLISSMVRGNLKLDLETLAVADTIREIIAIHMEVDYGKPVLIEWSGKDFQINADRTRFHQIMRNIIDNAVKYSGKRAHISVATEMRDGEGIIRVTDEGQGISGDDLPRIFDKFYRGEEGEGVANGMGVGLSIARELTESMGGSIVVESESGKGSTFIVKMPLA